MTIWLYDIAEALLLIGLAPLAAVFIQILKARLQNRRGPSFWQTYRDLVKLFYKEPVLADQASWVFRLAPYVIFTVTVLAAAIVPVIFVYSPLSAAADVITLVGLLSMARFFTALGAMDPGTSFGGMGASREMTLSALAEPAMLMSVFILSMAAQSTDLSTMMSHMLNGHLGLQPSLVFAFVAMLSVAIAETGRIPVDNPTTHLELTMIHEAMILEYSGHYLALIEWANQIKLLLFATLITNLFLPWGMAMEASGVSPLLGTLAWVGKILVLFVLLALLETGMAKMRIFRVPDFLGLAFLMAIIGMLTHFILEVSI